MRFSAFVPAGRLAAGAAQKAVTTAGATLTTVLAKSPYRGRLWNLRRRLDRNPLATLGFFATALFGRCQLVDVGRLYGDRHEGQAEVDCPWCRSLQRAEERAAGGRRIDPPAAPEGQEL